MDWFTKEYKQCSAKHWLSVEQGVNISDYMCIGIAPCVKKLIRPLTLVLNA